MLAGRAETTTSTTAAKAGATRSSLITIIDLTRPLILFATFIALDVKYGLIYGAPFAIATFFAAAVLVHDLIHNAYALPKRANDFALAFYALFIIKSGHALRRLHLEHHARCLEDEDHEGNVVLIATWKLVLTGPWLAARARWLSYEREKNARGWQIVESILNLVITALLAYPWWQSLRPNELGPLFYLGVVFVNTITVPIFGAKLPHLLPEKAPWLVKTLRRFTTRLTPASSSLLFHELHHRRPRIAAPFLAENAGLLETTDPSNCAKTYDAHQS